MKNNLLCPLLVVSLLLIIIVYDINHGKFLKRGYHKLELWTMGSVQWENDFQKVSIKSQYSNDPQLAYFYNTNSKLPRPLIISLHTWGGDYNQYDSLAELCVANNINYIHPDFFGPNKTPNSCCSELVIGQIDEAINYAILNSNVDENNIHVIGLSGGGYTALCHYLSSTLPIKSYQSWVGISDLESWYNQSLSKENTYGEDILACTNSKNTLDVDEARKRSPLYMTRNKKKAFSSTLNIYSGVHDGFQGSVPITHSINFYNKMVSKIYGKNAPEIVKQDEILHLLEFRTPLGVFGSIDKRKLYLVRNTPKINLYIFDGGHEILPKHSISSTMDKIRN